MFKECLERTTAHGIPHLVDRRNNIVAKFFWITIIMGSMGIFGWHTSSLIGKYFQFETAVSINLDSANFIIPDIFVCNNNPFSYLVTNDHLAKNNSAYIKFLLNTSSWDTYDHKDNLLNRFYPGLTKTELYEILSRRNYNDFMIPNDDRYAFVSEGSFGDWFEIVPNSYHIWCYKLKDKYKSNVYFKDRIDISLYTDEHSLLQVDHEDTRVLKSHLQLHAAMNAFGNLLESSHTVYFTSPGQYPHLASSNVKIERGTRSEITLHMDYYDKINRKNHECLNKYESVTYQNSINDSDFLTYQANVIDCAYESLNEDLLNLCNCTYGLHPINENLRTKNKTKLCWDALRFLGNWDRFCFEGYLMSSGIHNRDCRNKTMCEFAIYRTESDSYPLRDKFISDIIQGMNPFYYGFMIKDWDSGKMNISVDKMVRQSFCQLTIHAPNYLSTLYKENFVYDVKDLLSDIGGILGFYVGVSVVTFMEVFGFAARYISSLCQRRSPLLERRSCTEKPEVDSHPDPTVD